MKNQSFLLSLLVLLVFQACQKTDSVMPNDEPVAIRSTCQHQITIPAGSVDALQAAIDDLCAGGTITLAAGMHTENTMVVIDKRLTLKGEAGAVLKVSSTPDNSAPTVGLHVYNAQNVRLENFELLPTGDDGGIGILLQNANQATVKNCVIRHHMISILLEQSDHANITGNLVEASLLWQTAGIFCHGIVVTNGEKAVVMNNEIFHGFWGMWACDKDGIFKGNYTHDNFTGLILCRVGEDYAYTLPDGTQAFAEFACTSWQVSNNVSTDNAFVGYLVIDGANNNHLNNNQGGNNAAYDMELKGWTGEFGPCLPTSFGNLVNAGSYDLLIKNCGENNTIIGGTLSDDPCHPDCR
ncbi:MAG: hypothetical protein EP344_02445 [Bacteroidetes bacterium]|nr:MAG: hypothetical protein EP344_02445 [Bacteroidota bacterium]